VRVEDVAREAGVSPITVSRALRTPDLVKEETRLKVTEAVARTGYVVNSIASSLRSGRSSIVTVFVASLRNPHFASAMQGALDAFEGSRFHLMFAQAGYSDELSARVVETLLPFRPAGLIFTGMVRRDETREALRELGVPVVEMWGNRPDPVDMLVGASDYEGGRQMAAHFAEMGLRRVAFCGTPAGEEALRLEGFVAGLAAHGLAPALVLPIEGEHSVTGGIAALDAILEALPDCDGVFFSSDLLAVGALIATQRRGIAVPSQLALAGYGGFDYSQHVDPAITTVHVPNYELGHAAGSMLLRRLTGTDAGEPVIHVPVSLLARASTGRN
jgi:LacI family gluconate utilization system Gnt-I transcriptional repressor